MLVHSGSLRFFSMLHCASDSKFYSPNDYDVFTVHVRGLAKVSRFAKGKSLSIGVFSLHYGSDQTGMSMLPVRPPSRAVSSGNDCKFTLTRLRFSSPLYRFQVSAFRIRDDFVVESSLRQFGSRESRHSKV